MNGTLMNGTIISPATDPEVNARAAYAAIVLLLALFPIFVVSVSCACITITTALIAPFIIPLFFVVALVLIGYAVSVVAFLAGICNLFLLTWQANIPMETKALLSFLLILACSVIWHWILKDPTVCNNQKY